MALFFFLLINWDASGGVDASQADDFIAVLLPCILSFECQLEHFSTLFEINTYLEFRVALQLNLK